MSQHSPHPYIDDTSAAATTNKAIVETSNTGTLPNLPNQSVRESEGEEQSLLARAYYARNSNKLKVLIPMTIGLNGSTGKPLFDEDQAPWSSGHIKKNDWKPTNAHLNQEVTRRYEAYCFENYLPRKPAPKRWDKQQALSWLREHPINWNDNGITDAALDVEFVRGEIARRAAQMSSAVEELEAEKDALEGRWSGDQPMLRLIHCLVEFDHIRSAFLHRNDSMNRNTLENRNSESRRAKTCWELMSEVWNDPQFNPKTMVFNTEGQCDECYKRKDPW